MNNFKPLKIAEYRHREHSRPGRPYGMTPVLVGPRSYTQHSHRWKVVSRVITNGPINERGERPAEELSMILTAGGKDRLSYGEAIIEAHRVTDQLVKETTGVIDQHYQLFVLIPSSEMAAKVKAKSKRRNKK